MFSSGGGDSNSDGYNSINQFSSFGLGGGGSGGLTSADVDWASLAQQWIKSRDSAVMPEPPPPPNISGNYFNTNVNMPTDYKLMQTTNNRQTTFEEKGEADMDMDDDEDNLERSERYLNVPQPITTQHQQQQKQNNTWVSGARHIKQLPQQQQQPQHHPQQIQQQQTHLLNIGLPTVNLNVEEQRANPVNMPWNMWPTRMGLAPQLVQMPITTAVNPTAHIPPLMKINVPHPNITKLPTNIANENTMSDDNNSSVTSIDAAKRKILPAWLREGLEKMEREKQKQLEKNQMGATKDELSDLDVEHGSVSELNRTNNELTVKNNLESYLASDSSGNEDDNIDADEDIATNNNMKGTKRHANERLKLKSNNSNDDYDTKKSNKSTANYDDDDDDGDYDDKVDDGCDDDFGNMVVGKSYEQKYNEMMVIVRKTLTELLLEVTNEEIANIAQETIKNHQNKASSVQVIRKNALSSITGKLGLAAYADSTDDDDSDEENDDATATDNERTTHGHEKFADSDEELRSIVRVKRRAFIKTAEEIQEKVEETAKREEEKLKYYTELEKKQERQQPSTSLTQRSNLAFGIGPSEEDIDGVNNNAGVGGGGSAAAISVGKNYERHFGEATESMYNQQLNGKRQKERSSRNRGERQTRFSDNKDAKSQSIAAAATIFSKIAQQSHNSNSSHHQHHQMRSSGKSILAQPMNAKPMNVNAITPDPNGLFTTQMINNAALSAAEAVLERATKSSATSSKKITSPVSSTDSKRRQQRHSSQRHEHQTSTRSHERHSRHSHHHSRRRHRRHGSRHSSDNDTNSDNSDNSTATSNTSSRHSSKHSYASSSRNKSRNRTQHSSSTSTSKRKKSTSRDKSIRAVEREDGRERARVRQREKERERDRRRAKEHKHEHSKRTKDKERERSTQRQRRHDSSHSDDDDAEQRERQTSSTLCSSREQHNRRH